MRILFGIDLFYPFLYGGGEVYAFNVAKALAKLGHDVHVICAKSDFAGRRDDLPTREIISGVQITRVKGLPNYRSTISSIPYQLQVYQTSKEIISSQQIDIVNPYVFRPCVPLWLAARDRVPCVATVFDIYSSGKMLGCENWFRVYGKKGLAGWTMEQTLLRLPYDRIITISEHVRRKIERYFNTNAIDVTYCAADHLNTNSTRVPKIPGQVVYIGRLVEYKHVDDLIRAVEIARAESNEISLCIIGSGPLENYVRRMASVRPYLSYHPRPPLSNEEKKQRIAESAVLALPSSEEGFGITLIEGLELGTPYVAYDIPAVREITKITGGGLLARHRSVADLAEKIMTLIKDDALREELASRGGQVVKQKFTWDIVAKRVERAYQRCLRR